MLVLQVLFHYGESALVVSWRLKKNLLRCVCECGGGGKEEVLPVKGNSRKAEVVWNFWRYFVLTMAAIYPDILQPRHGIHVRQR